MKQHHIQVADFKIGNDLPFVLFAGPCVIEGEDFTLQVATDIRDICQRVGVSLVFKSSFDKANRTSVDGFRGPGLEEGLRILQRVKDEVGVPIITDIHTPEQVEKVAKVADIMQTPAFLCRQTDFIIAVASREYQKRSVFSTVGHATCVRKSKINRKHGHYVV